MVRIPPGDTSPTADPDRTTPARPPATGSLKRPAESHTDATALRPTPAHPKSCVYGALSGPFYAVLRRYLPVYSTESNHPGKALTVRLVPQNQPADATDRQEGDNVIRLSPKPFMSTEELAGLLDVDPSTIRRWRTLQPLQGPPFIQISDRVVKYATADVERWLSARRVYPQAA